MGLKRQVEGKHSSPSLSPSNAQPHTGAGQERDTGAGAGPDRAVWQWRIHLASKALEEQAGSPCQAARFATCLPLHQASCLPRKMSCLAHLSMPSPLHKFSLAS